MNSNKSHLLAILLLLLSVAIADASVSVTALNEYGASEQLSNAANAAELQGRLHLAALASSGDIVVASTCEKLPRGVLPKRSLLNIVWKKRQSPSSPSSRHEQPICLVCTGVKPDMSWLLRSLREYSKRVWERYGDPQEEDDTADAIVCLESALVSVLLDFMDYEREKELSGGAGPILYADKEEKDRKPLWGRPFGLQSFLVHHGAPLLFLEPSGVRRRYRAFAMGRKSPDARKILEERYSSNLTTNQVKDLFCNVFKETAASADTPKVVLEVLRQDGQIHQTIKELN